jgi:endo-1,4-beta-xylanase
LIFLEWFGMTLRSLFVALGVGICAASAGATSAQAQSRKMDAVFSPVPIEVDGQVDSAWSRASPSDIGICVTPPRTSPPARCVAAGTVRAVWHGPVLYLLFSVTDPDVDTTSPIDSRRSGVQLFIDQYNDKFPKFEEDDGYVLLSAVGQQSGNRPNANLPYYPALWSTHLQSSAAALRADASGRTIGYTVEVAWHIGDLPLRNGTTLGMEVAVNAVSSATHTLLYQQFWSSGNNKGTNDNSTWGEVTLAGFDESSPMPLNSFMLQDAIRKATPAQTSDAGMVRGIWRDESGVDRALAAATSALRRAKAQTEIDAASGALEAALRRLRRSGKHPDPYDLPAVGHLTDPFAFRDGSKVRTAADWDRRRAEIKDLAQYYEFGYMPARAQSLTAVSTSNPGGALSSRSIAVTVQDGGRSASFTPVLFLPPAGTAPYPVVVQLDFRSSPATPPNRAFTEAGYAVLSIPTSDNPAMKSPGVASDDGNHTGAFYSLYPYKLDREGNDRGVLLAWAWGASRGVDALEYLAAHDPDHANLLDLKKLVVTGFSRWGKAALVAGFFDDRFGVTAPGGSGSGGAAPYRYDSFGNRPFRSAPFGNVYPWGRSTGAETMGDHVRHQTHNSNEMIRRFLNDATPETVLPRMYRTGTAGYGERLPFDHHEIIAAIAPRAVIVNNTNDDYADNAEGDAIGFEGAKPVYAFLNVLPRLALDIFMGGGGHSLKPSQSSNIVAFANMVFFDKPLSDEVRKQLATDPYLEAGTYDTYYGGLKAMMPWNGSKVDRSKVGGRQAGRAGR